ncbi:MULTISPECIES: DUF456 domain-containing protein [Micrococcaceae]|uniref:DUF456 domain-containing protein n=1 Tax=unclassified Kocuria TaxID=2649579 RepID=UPI00101358CD|nr:MULTISPECIES: DUF456 domain-containing protein [unclassified Kocuria]
MTAVIVATVVAALLIVVGILGIIFPVLPGSVLVLAATLVWSLTVRAPEGWWVLGLGGGLALVGLCASLVLTGRTMKRRSIPNRSLLYGVIGAVVGMFVLPVLGLVIGFAVGLFASEVYRQKDLGAAFSSSVAALKAAGIGMLIELVCALIAGTVFVIAGLTYFITA